MFQAPRQLFRRSSAAADDRPVVDAKDAESASERDRHPAMRGIDVSPVHGRHCICNRCEEHHNAA
ncbi:MAG: hypothetical protein J2O48_06385 [Solirubrobacterales bacterium]|nr:hypothetical protein [Solirubrobacterales bacterium]